MDLKRNVTSEYTSIAFILHVIDVTDKLFLINNIDTVNNVVTKIELNDTLNYF